MSAFSWKSKALPWCCLEIKISFNGIFCHQVCLSSWATNLSLTFAILYLFELHPKQVGLITLSCEVFDSWIENLFFVSRALILRQSMSNLNNRGFSVCEWGVHVLKMLIRMGFHIRRILNRGNKLFFNFTDFCFDESFFLFGGLTVERGGAMELSLLFGCSLVLTKMGRSKRWRKGEKWSTREGGWKRKKMKREEKQCHVS